jgi:hypothetical protein
LSEKVAYFSSCETAVRLAPKITESLKGKLSLGARILHVGGMEKVFKQLFDVREGEKPFKASQCYLSTTTGPIAGLLFISTDKIAFCSEKPIKISCPSGEFSRIHYKVTHIIISITQTLSLSLSLCLLTPLRNLCRS